MVLNLLLFATVFSAVAFGGSDHLALFTYPATRREIVPFNFSEAATVLETHINTTAFPTPLSSRHRLAIEANAMNAAGCNVGILSSITTPACDCVEGILHARFLAFVGGNASRFAPVAFFRFCVLRVLRGALLA